MPEDLSKKIWWDFLEEDLQELLKESLTLIDRVGTWDDKYHDYAFVVFPASKAYEGFLKKLFLSLGFITQDDYSGKAFRIGKALNPSLNRKYRKDDYVYEKLVNYCEGEDLAKVLWRTWKNCRNLLFHWFPNERNSINFDQAKEKVDMIIDSIDRAFAQCKIKSND